MELVPTQEEMDAAQKGIKDSFVDIPNGQGGRVPMAVICRANTDVSHRERNVEENFKKDIPRFLHRPDLMHIRFGEPIAVVGGGPSVKDYLDEIRKFRMIMAAGSAHDYLVSEGIVPTFAVSTDSSPHTVDFYQNPQKGCAYIFASTSPPALFDKVEGYDRYLFHFNEQVDQEHYRGEQSIGWGCMVGVVCIQLALWLGFQKHHYFGYDCCFDEGGTHAYPVSEKERSEIFNNATIAEVGEEKTRFITTTALICQCTHFYGVYRSQDGQYLKGYVYGRGLLWDNIRQSPPEMKRWLEAV